MDKLQRLTFAELRECQNQYLKLAKKYKKYEKLKELYNELDEWHLKDVISGIGYVNALDDRATAYKTMKIDPYLAGGAAQALGGAGLGLYSAISAEEHNREVDQARTSTSVTAIERKVNYEMVESRLWNVCKSILSVLDTMPESSDIKSSFLNNLYNEAKSLASAGMNDEAIQKFELLNGYKDSRQRIESLKTKKSNARQMMILVCSLILALFVDIVSGVLFISFEAAIVVFIIGFLISFIYLQFKIK